jgi:pimeloyl-ACP methyl ester carboxylesterase
MVPSGSEDDDRRGPLDRLEVLHRQEVEITAELAHLEIFTSRGLLSLLWHGPRTAESVVLLCSGGGGGLLGPANGIYQDLGTVFAHHGIGSIRVGYRRAGNLDLCLLDVLVAADLATRSGAERFVLVGHSFGGAVAVRGAVILGRWTAGVVTLATQSTGCEVADRLAGVPLLLLHGDRDELIPVMASGLVHQLAGGLGELAVLPGCSHTMIEADHEIRRRLLPWIPARFAEHERRSR